MTNLDEIKNSLKKRNPESHKGDYGKDLIVAGSAKMAGAAILSSRAALRSGAGLIYVAANPDMYDVIHISNPEAVIVDRDLSNLEKYDAILIGPGMGNTLETKELLLNILTNYSGPLVMDADCLNVISAYNLYTDVKKYKGPKVITPHTGEAFRLVKKKLDRSEMVDSLEELLDSIVLLKGNNTIVKYKDKEYINHTGNPGMATAGMGDVLSGIIVSLIGQGIEPFKATCLASYVHGLSGDIVRDKIGEDGLIASDIIEAIPNTLKLIKEK